MPLPQRDACQFKWKMLSFMVSLDRGWLFRRGPSTVYFILQMRGDSGCSKLSDELLRSAMVRAADFPDDTGIAWAAQRGHMGCGEGAVSTA